MFHGSYRDLGVGLWNALGSGFRVPELGVPVPDLGCGGWALAEDSGFGFVMFSVLVFV